jgi:hypothetical protein
MEVSFENGDELSGTIDHWEVLVELGTFQMGLNIMNVITQRNAC